MKPSHPKFWLSVVGTLALLAVLAACGPSIPTIRDLKVGKDKDVSMVSGSFGPCARES